MAFDGLFQQNVIAIIWDFDKTLSPNYMQDPLFKKYNVDAKLFWEEVNKLPKLYSEKGIKVNKDTIYLNHILTYLHEDKFKDLTNDVLRELGKEIELFPGLPDFLEELKGIISRKEEKYGKFGITVEHYVVSTGLTEMIKGNSIFNCLDGVWGCEFLAGSVNFSTLPLSIADDKKLIGIGYTIDNTTKTRAIFEINKGVNKFPEEVDVNAKIPEQSRRVPFSNMIYIADGPSDIPAFSVVRQYGGRAYAVYKKDDLKSFKQADTLLQQGRIDMYGEANYQKGSSTYLWLITKVKEIADKIFEDKNKMLTASAGSIPQHII